jgi:uncharacterized membrane protein (GlpM family)
MLIKLHLGAVKRTRWHEYLTRFVLGGLITAMTGWLANRYGPVLGGLFLTFPAIFPASATLLEKHERAQKRNAGIASTIRGRRAAALEARGALLGAIGGMVFAALVWKLLPRTSLTATLILALVSWLCVSSLLWYVRKHHARLHSVFR